MLIVAIAGYYILKYKKTERLGFKDERDVYNRGSLVSKSKLHKVVGIKKKNAKSFLEEHQDVLVVHNINSKEYYSVEDLKIVLNSKIINDTKPNK